MNLDEAIQKTIKKFEQDKARTATATRPAKATPKPTKISAAVTRAANAGPVTWNEIVALIAKRDKISLSEAARRACKECPDIHPISKIQKQRRGR